MGDAGPCTPLPPAAPSPRHGPPCPRRYIKARLQEIKGPNVSLELITDFLRLQIHLLRLFIPPPPCPLRLMLPRRRLPLTGSGTTGRATLGPSYPTIAQAGMWWEPCPHPSWSSLGRSGDPGSCPLCHRLPSALGLGPPASSCAGDRAGDMEGASSREWWDMAKAPSCPHAGDRVPPHPPHLPAPCPGRASPPQPARQGPVTSPSPASPVPGAARPPQQPPSAPRAPVL